MGSTSEARTSSSAGASQPSSIRSVDVSAKSSPTLAPQNGHHNGVPNSAEQVLKPVEKTSVKERLTRMFSTKDTQRSSNLAPPSGDKSAPVSPGLAPPVRNQPPSRKGSTTDKASEKTAAASAAKAAKSSNGTAHQQQRFLVNPDAQGGHEHHLKSSRRQEKLSDMFRSMLGGGKRAEQQDHDLSLVSGWVDTLKQEKDKDKDVGQAGEKRGGPNASVTLVEKYGKCQEVVGRGAFGIVRISHKKMDNGAGERLFAVKEFRRRPEENEKKYSKRLTAEFCISSSLRHPNVIHTLDLLQDAKGDYCEVMEFCPGGDLYTLVLAAGKLEVQEADCFFKQMMRGVEYMHEMGVAHRDLKPENLLLTTHGALKITDFGNGECFRMAWENDAHMVSGLCGSGPYIAPEEYTSKEFDARAVDVWACGVIYMAMRTGRHLWRIAKKDEDEFYARYLEGRRDEEGYGPIESLHRARCRNVIYSILDPNPSRRITASQVLKSEWGREIKLCKAGEEGL
ncbi:Pkinase-domain-containing protein [Pyricularia oryzae]|uniref:non-specific serine/threonine protein kinase n=5 Tax=Pyricularia TaxID=48558 RepID=A0ABQ8N9D0_PYRGI|nr:HAL protein kinase [Pyricularia oryzae 70-15]ELQ44411.1 serine/threonine-protein kinase hal4 [Pyricularia oryzae Y34]KAH8843431.1 Pkinase-domain-containing protein [Pyricularia oryzae]KAI6293408.1 Pkinase-domain-containing protein [Pyricularia grisea]EHA50829.1 HAL protein kinase [Pyricularia oryzae 70-15]KAI6252744.1 Pkinase-domain-containing protein [Pyricularia oryzae]